MPTCIRNEKEALNLLNSKEMFFPLVGSLLFCAQGSLGSVEGLRNPNLAAELLNQIELEEV